MFLALMIKNPGQFLVPCFDIDLAWHTHQVHVPEPSPTDPSS